jgi:hypothetical protein
LPRQQSSEVARFKTIKAGSFMSVTKPPNISDVFGEEILTEKFENEGSVAQERKIDSLFTFGCLN